MFRKAKMFFMYATMIATAAVVSVAAPQRAEAKSCSASCPGGTCKATSWFGKVTCYCNGDYPVCTAGFVGTSEGVALRGSSDGTVVVFASDEQLARMQERIEAAIQLELFDVAAAGEKLYDALELGDANAYSIALSEYDLALSALSDEAWTSIEALGQ